MINLESYLIPAMESNSEYENDKNVIRAIYYKFTQLMKQNGLRASKLRYTVYYNFTPSNDTPAWMRITYPYYDDNYSGTGSDYDNGLSESNKNEKFTNLIPNLLREFKKYPTAKVYHDGYRGHGCIDIIINAAKYSNVDIDDEIEKQQSASKTNQSSKNNTRVESKEDKLSKQEKKRENKKLLDEVLSELKKKIVLRKINNRGYNKYRILSSYDYSKENYYACIQYNYYTKDILAYYNSIGVDTDNGEIVKIMPEIIDELKTMYPNVKFEKVVLKQSDLIRYFIILQ